MTVSVGGEIGEVGGKNSDIHELHAYMKGFDAALEKRGNGLVGLSKISVQTGTAHGGFINADGTLRMDVKIDLKTLEELSRVSRTDYGLGGAVQHGASTLPPEYFGHFPDNDCAEIHLATDFMNTVYDHPAFPYPLKREIERWLDENAADERRKGETQPQFLYKTRKKAIGPYKEQVWNLPEGTKEAIRDTLEEKFAFLFGKLRVGNTRALVAKYVQPESVYSAGAAAAGARAGFVRDDQAGD